MPVEIKKAEPDAKSFARINEVIRVLLPLRA